MTRAGQEQDDGATMLASVLVKREERSGIELQRVPLPAPGLGQVAIEIRAAALNHLDLYSWQQHVAATDAAPRIIGSDAAGVVAEVGTGVEGWQPGQAVVLNPGLSCGRCEFCKRGEQSECLQFDIVGRGVPGTFAERVVLPAENLFPKPEHLDYTAAAALPLAHLTAWRMIFTRGGLRAGQSLLIHGIGGGVALAALQLGKLAGARVIVTSSSQKKLQRAEELGADEPVDYSSAVDVATRVRELTGGRGVDLVIDTVGAATLPLSVSAVRNGGRVVVCGATTGAEGRLDLRELFWRQIAVVGSTMGSQEDFRRMLEAVSAQRMAPVIDSVRPLAGAENALDRLRQAGQFGKIVLQVSQSGGSDVQQS